ncbi:two pore domain potassium channel number 2 [Elysia marginata]|uniref:Two pore domain potassium channel number 2 n=1 Tax=Elysia marginata TaxID=1093978 RepID=A0AAV4I9S1_9GAST|nr:two pore domain potassium channel number 2 [Elysia marginata]
MGLSWIALILSEISTMMQSQMNHVANSTSHRLSNLEVLVRKKAKETRDRFSKRDFYKDMYELTHIKAFQSHASEKQTVVVFDEDKSGHGQTNNVMVMSIAAGQHVSEDEADGDFSEDTNIVSCHDPGGSSNNDSSDLTQWNNINGNISMFDEYNGHALPNTDELTNVVET